MSAPPAFIQITQLLPPEGEAFQYRIKNVNEPHERVAKENNNSSEIERLYQAEDFPLLRKNSWVADLVKSNQRFRVYRRLKHCVLLLAAPVLL